MINKKKILIPKAVILLILKCFIILFETIQRVEKLFSAKLCTFTNDNQKFSYELRERKRKDELI